MRFVATISQSKLVHVAIAAFIGAVLTPVYTVLDTGNMPSPHAEKMIVFAAIAAALRAAILVVPSKA